MLALRIAFRYLFSRKSTHAINIISWVSMLGMGVGAFALIVVLSVFNGFESLVLSLYGSYYPDIQIAAAQGKFFERDTALESKLLQLSEVDFLSKTIEENAYLEYGGHAQIAVVKGVDDRYGQVTSVPNYIRTGSFLLHDSIFEYAVVGGNIAYELNMHTDATSEPLRVTVPKRGVKQALLPEDAFSTRDVLPAGIFTIQQEFDSKIVFVSLETAQRLIGEEEELSAYEIKLKPGTSTEDVQQQIADLCGTDLVVKNRYEQKQELYRIMKLERWAVFALLSFIMVIISFNIIGSLSMLVIEKRSDIGTLKSMGANASLIQKIFLLTGMLNALLGAFVGLLLGGLVGWLQQRFGFIQLTDGGGTFVINAYPVVFHAIDFVATLLVVVVISLAAAYIPARRASTSLQTYSYD